MDWTPGGLSGDVEDRRGESGGGGGFGGGGGGGLGIVGVVVLVVVSLVTGHNLHWELSWGRFGCSAAAKTESIRSASVKRASSVIGCGGQVCATGVVYPGEGSGFLGADAAGPRDSVPAREGCALSWVDLLGVWNGAIGGRTVLLPG